MFGYVIPNQAALDDEAKARYRTAYCGLCRRIGALHGLRGRLTLSYDLTFLDLLLSSLYEGESEYVTGSGHCPIHPIRKINWRHSGPTDYCADMSVALHYYNLSLIHISEPTRRTPISYAVFCLKKKKKSEKAIKAGKSI